MIFKLFQRFFLIALFCFIFFLFFTFYSNKHRSQKSCYNHVLLRTISKILLTKQKKLHQVQVCLGFFHSHFIVFLFFFFVGVLLISNCKQSKVIAHGTCIKVVIERCQNCEIILDAKLISGLLEIVHSSGIKLTVATKIPTICVDLSDGVSIAFDQQKGAKLEKLFSAKTKSVSIKRDAQAGTLENIEDATDLDVAVQNVSHITSEGKLITEKVIRENG